MGLLLPRREIEARDAIDRFYKQEASADSLGVTIAY
jgi:hypothetical protein